MTTSDRVLTMIRRALDSGKTVEIDGLGTFRPGAAGAYDFAAQTEPRVFIAYVEEDLRLARRLRDRIAAAGCSTWMDKDKLMPGQNWPLTIRRAIEISDVFVACFSPCSSIKRGPFQSELRWALHCAQRMPLEESFVIPVRFEECAVPHEIAEELQYVDLFPDWEAGIKRVLRVVKKAGKAGQKPGCRLVQT